MGHGHGLSRLHRRAPGDGIHLDLGRPAHRSDRRPRGDVDRHDHRLGRAARVFAGARHASYLAVWAVLGVGMRCCLYDAAFVALVQVTPTRGRKAISYLTLYGAYASTVFWVIGHYLNEAYGWRNTLMIFAAINLAVCLPLNWVGLSRREAMGEAAAAGTAAASPDGPVLEGRMRVVGMILFALIMSINGFVFGVISLQLVPLLEAAGLAGATAVWVASLKGHGQFAGRVVEIFFGRNLKAMTIARIAIAVVPASLLLLLLARGDLWLLVAFTLLLGASQGVITIVRGAVPLALFGAKGYGAVLGLIATPILLVNAFSPAIFALIVDQFGWQVVALRAAGLLDRDLGRHRADVPVVRGRPVAGAQPPGCVGADAGRRGVHRGIEPPAAGEPGMIRNRMPTAERQ